MMKKVISFCAAIVMGLCLFCGCKPISLNPFDYDGNFFDKGHLEEHLIPDLPQPNIEVYRDDGETILYYMTEEQFESYAREVYDYLVSCNFQRMGTPSDIWAFSGVYKCFEFEDYWHDFDRDTELYGYIFCWANERWEKNDDEWVDHFLEVVLETDGTVMLKLCNFIGYSLRESWFFSKAENE